jgi:hypothetical protein
MRTAAKLAAVRAGWCDIQADVEWLGDPDILELGEIIGLLLHQFTERLDSLELDEPVEAVGT